MVNVDHTGVAPDATGKANEGEVRSWLRKSNGTYAGVPPRRHFSLLRLRVCKVRMTSYRLSLACLPIG